MNQETRKRRVENRAYPQQQSSQPTTNQEDYGDQQQDNDDYYTYSGMNNHEYQEYDSAEAEPYLYEEEQDMYSAYQQAYIEAQRNTTSRVAFDYHHSFSKPLAALIALFLGILGGHRYYLGYYKSGIIQTIGGVGFLIVAPLLNKRIWDGTIFFVLTPLALMGVFTLFWILKDLINILREKLTPADGSQYNVHYVDDISNRRITGKARKLGVRIVAIGLALSIGMIYFIGIKPAQQQVQNLVKIARNESAYGVSSILISDTSEKFYAALQIYGGNIIYGRIDKKTGNVDTFNTYTYITLSSSENLSAYIYQLGYEECQLRLIVGEQPSEAILRRVNNAL